MSDFPAKTDQIRSRVRRLYRGYPEIAENDNILIFRYWEKYEPDHMYREGSIFYIDLFNVPELTRCESIVRAMRKLVEDGIINRPPKVQEARFEEEEHYRRHYGVT